MKNSSHLHTSPALGRGAFVWLIRARSAGLILLSLLFLAPALASAQLPDENTNARLVWSTMITLDNANRTNDYTMLHHLGSKEFQKANTPQDLSKLFAPMRNSRIDIGRAVLVAPTYYLAPGSPPQGAWGVPAASD